MRLAAALLALALATPAYAAENDVPLVFPVHGRLLDGSDQPVNGDTRITFAIYPVFRDNPGTTTPARWKATYDVSVDRGTFGVALGDRTDTASGGTALPADVFAASAEAWLGITIGGGPELQPRLRIASVPYALRAARARDADTVGGESPADLHDAAKLTGLAPLPSLKNAVDAAQAALDAAKADFDAKLATEAATREASLVEAKTYADTKGADALAAAQLHADAQDAATLAGAKSYADSKDASTLASAKSYADTKGATALSDAKSYSDAKDATTLAGAKAYADTQAAGALSGAKTYADAQAATALASAKSYSDASATAAIPASCAALKAQDATLPSGVYTVRPAGAPGPFQVYCDMVTDGGGWTLVWSNLRGWTNRATTGIPYAVATTTLPLYNGRLGWHLEKFEVYTGLKWWGALGPSKLFRYDWANEYGSAIDQSWKCTLGLDAADKYRLSLTGCAARVGTGGAPGITGHHGSRFSTTDADHDTESTNCASNYSATPWWYSSCWSGSINGGGESSGQGYYNGAYWSGSTATWGTDAGVGAGNGWMYVK